MKHLNKITLTVLLLAAVDMVGPLNASKGPNIDEIDALIAKSSKTLKTVEINKFLYHSI
jgi:hypothetical protein